jgi:hypothetical protein
MNLHIKAIYAVCINYLRTYDLYGPVRNAFDADTTHYALRTGPYKS